MSELFSQLGINLPALIWQALNFLVVLVVLYFGVYRPLAKIVAQRRRVIEKGLEDAARAASEVERADAAFALRMNEAEVAALGVVNRAKSDADVVAKQIVAKGEERGEGIVKEARTLASRARAEEMVSLEREARSFIQAALEKTVGMSPKDVDTKLIDEAVRLVKSESHA